MSGRANPLPAGGTEVTSGGTEGNGNSRYGAFERLSSAEGHADVNEYAVYGADQTAHSADDRVGDCGANGLCQRPGGDTGLSQPNTRDTDSHCRTFGQQHGHTDTHGHHDC